MSSPMSVLCITFGSPLLGNEALQRSILRQRWGGNFCHVVSNHDIMPRLLLFTETMNHISIIQSWLHFWHYCMASPHVIADGISSQLPQDLKTNVFQCVLKDLEVLARAEDLSAESSFWPLGSYVFCSREGAVCVKNATSIIRMMYLMMAMSSLSCCIEDHLMYGDYVGNVSKQFLKAKSFHENGEGIPDSNFEAGVALALQSSDLTYKEPVQVQELCFSMQTSSNLRENVAVIAKECQQMGQNDHRPNLTAANLAIRLSKLVPFRAEIEWYKACCDEADDQMGYYDSFMRKTGSRREARVNMNRHKLASFWDSVFSLS
ncbi:lipase-like PAD4 [Hibiscus syriacus]|uniref:lipase-like PAD4 n=1 Tax=Hibiscus syriacus TaxID=106335 RepID=UPI001921F42A|nr:lipase-like PAD4 [Hibiscus syriacus]